MVQTPTCSRKAQVHRTSPLKASVMLLVTVPHGKREASDNHDEGAINMVPYLTRALDNVGVPHTIHIGNDSFRSILDYNRAESRHTEYSKEFTRLLQENHLLIDLHSYPYMDDETPDSDSITSHGDDLREWSRSDVVFLTLPSLTDQPFSERMMSKLEEHVIVDDIESDYYNYLTVFSQLVMYVPAVLLELNEGSSEAFPLVAKVVAEAVAEHLGLIEPADA